jgi:hypothetical protein
VIQYSPNYIQGERINVGLLLHDPATGELIFSILDDNNLKVKSLLADDVLNRTFKVQRDYLDLFLSKFPVEHSLIGPNKHKNDFLSQINSELPSEFIISEPTLSITTNPQALFTTLLGKYIGEIYLNNEIDMQIRTVKTIIKDHFQSKDWIGTKIKQNAKLRPKNLQSMQFQIDFVFKNGIWNLIQAVPSNQERITEWFSKTRTMIDAYQEDSLFYVMYSDDNVLSNDKSIEQMITYLKSKDNRVKEVEITSPSFKTFCEKVETEAKDISTLEEDELIAL